MNLIEALKSLDPNDDSQWTQDGAPLLEVMKELTGAPVSRDAIAAVASGFSRSNPLVEEAEQSVENTQATEGTTSKTETSPEVVLDSEDAEDAAVETEFVAATKGFQDAKKRLEKATQAQDKLTLKRSAALRQQRPADTIKAFQDSQRAQRIAAAERAKKSGIDAEALRLAMHK